MKLFIPRNPPVRGKRYPFAQSERTLPAPSAVDAHEFKLAVEGGALGGWGVTQMLLR